MLALPALACYHPGMTGEIEAVGVFATGALLGRAIEPKAGEGHGHSDMCLNCGTALIGPHCHRCGQSAHIHRSLGAIGHEILHGVAHFEGKLWRTLPMLAWRPGELTRRYVAGERARFVSPMAIFLFSIFAMFAAFSLVGLSPGTNLSLDSLSKDSIEVARTQLMRERSDAVEKRDRYAARGDPARVEEEAKIADLDKTLAELSNPAAQAEALPDLKAKAHTGWETLDHGIEKWQQNPSLMLYKLQSSGYKFSWLLIPLSLPFMWLLFFWRREYKLYDHTVFITYSIAFMSLLFIAVTLGVAMGIPPSWLTLASMLIPPIHIGRQLKQAYALGVTSTILRTTVLLGFIVVITMLFVLLLVAMGMSG